MRSLGNGWINLIGPPVEVVGVWDRGKAMMGQYTAWIVNQSQTIGCTHTHTHTIDLDPGRTSSKQGTANDAAGSSSAIINDAEAMQRFLRPHTPDGFT